MTQQIRIGSRASKLALVQAHMVRDALCAAHPSLQVEILAMTTAGDRDVHKQLSDWGYKGLFTKELEDALLERRIDLAVHSMKDMPSILPPGLHITAMLPRADVRDAWISPQHASIDALPHGATVGTASARRTAQLLHRRPDVKVVPLRGNVETRLRKLHEGEVSATFLAAAGLIRLGRADDIRSIIPSEEWLPAVAQGAIGIECRTEDAAMAALCAPMHHAPTMTCLIAERAFLQVLDGSCRTPIAGLATLEGHRLTLHGEVLSLDGTIRHVQQMDGAASDAEMLGKALGASLRHTAGEALLTHG
jgi:hydroxymethylbilane synthase